MTEHTADYPRLLDLTSRGFVVLGAGLGIGAESCRALAQCGAALVCVDIDGARAKQIADEVKGVPLTADVKKKSLFKRMFGS
jgi:3-oxoacyl-[acyl-carrier protein] reductase